MPLEFPNTPANGATNAQFVYDSAITAWRAQGSTNNVGTQIAALQTASPRTVANQAARDALFPSPVQGNSVWRNDLGAVETYYGLYNVSTNPGGRSVAEWYLEPKQRIIQMVSATYGNQVLNSSSTYADTGLSVGITPTQPGSKIIILVNQASVFKESSNGSSAVKLRLMRDATQLSEFSTIGLYTNSAAIQTQSISTSYVDSPTGPVTYKTQFANTQNVSYVGVQMSYANSSIIAMEITQ